MKIYELNRLLNVARAWAAIDNRTREQKIAFYLGVHAVVQCLDGMDNESVVKVLQEVSDVIDLNPVTEQ